MTDITSLAYVVYPPVDLTKLGAESARQDIYDNLEAIAVDEVRLDHSYARLGAMLLEFRRDECWRPLGYESFGKFLQEIHTKFNRDTSTLHGYIGVAEKLLPFVDAATLDQIGISKALEIKRALSISGRALTPEVIEAARDSSQTVKQLRAMLHEAYSLPADLRGEGATWFDFGGAWMTPSEKKEFLEAVTVMKRALGLTKSTPEWLQRKEILCFAMREAFATHAPAVYGTQPAPEPNVDSVG